jgi:hypothetical protein
MASLKSLTFESGSKLREIQSGAFHSSLSLKSIFLPASLSAIDGSSFFMSAIEAIGVDDANSNYFVHRPFLIGVEGMTLVRWFGQADDVIIDQRCGLLANLRITHIGPHAFSGRIALKSIWIAASIEMIGEGCFNDCSSLSELGFEYSSRLARIGQRAFVGCSSLRSILIPAEIELIPESCFAGCPSLADVRFERGSKLSAIDGRAFDDVMHSLLACPFVN